MTVIGKSSVWGRSDFPSDSARAVTGDEQTCPARVGTDRNGSGGRNVSRRCQDWCQTFKIAPESAPRSSAVAKKSRADQVPLVHSIEGWAKRQSIAPRALSHQPTRATSHSGTAIQMACAVCATQPPIVVPHPSRSPSPTPLSRSISPPHVLRNPMAQSPYSSLFLGFLLGFLGSLGGLSVGVFCSARCDSMVAWSVLFRLEPSFCGGAGAGGGAQTDVAARGALTTDTRGPKGRRRRRKPHNMTVCGRATGLWVTDASSMIIDDHGAGQSMIIDDHR